MADEIKNEEKKECKCFCKSKEFKKFVIVALGTFVGAYCALSLFAALHRPPMMHPQAFGPQGGMRNGCPCMVIKHHRHHLGREQRPDRQNFQKPDFNQNGPAPFETQARTQNQ